MIEESPQLFKSTHLEGVQLSYACYGKGKESLIAFHGYGIDHTSWKIAEKNWGEHYTIYSIDLPWHGQSLWNTRLGEITKQDWKTLMDEFLLSAGISSFSLAGYSMGGRFALVTSELFLERAKELYLFAPDGLKPNAWYTLATSNPISLSLFAYLSEHPLIYLKVSAAIHRLGLLSASLHKFADVHMRSKKESRRVFLTWRYFKHLQIEHKKWRAKACGKLRVMLIQGEYDKVIKNYTAKELSPLAPEIVNLHSGHTNLLARYFEDETKP